jgi:hypothetical protein
MAQAANPPTNAVAKSGEASASFEAGVLMTAAKGLMKNRQPR